jgi:hypothetical protein
MARASLAVAPEDRPMMQGSTLTRRALYLAGAIAMYAWRSRAKSRNLGATSASDATGITDVPPPPEDAHQPS